MVEGKKVRGGGEERCVIGDGEVRGWGVSGMLIGEGGVERVRPGCSWHSHYRSEAMVIGYIEQFVPNIYFLWVQCRPYNLLLNCFCRRKVK